MEPLIIDMNSKVQTLFPDLFTKKGTLVKREPKKYFCSCGHEFSKTSSIRYSGITFGSKTCSNCGKRSVESKSYNVWKRLKLGQIEQEDFILNVVKNEGTIRKEKLENLLKNHFKETSNALGTLCYFGYLHVDTDKRDNHGIIEYSINPKKDLQHRYELVR